MSSTLTLPQQVLRDALARAAAVPPDTLEEGTDVFDLGLDSLDFWAVLADVEDGVGAEVPPEVLDGLAQIEAPVTFGQVLDVLAVWLPAGRPGP